MCFARKWLLVCHIRVSHCHQLIVHKQPSLLNFIAHWHLKFVFLPSPYSSRRHSYTPSSSSLSLLLLSPSSFSSPSSLLSLLPPLLFPPLLLPLPSSPTLPHSHGWKLSTGRNDHRQGREFRLSLSCCWWLHHRRQQITLPSKCSLSWNDFLCTSRLHEHYTILKCSIS